eukprot:scaffold12626_cov77-Cyclotella_meneghiniana.AAC.5
MIVSWTRTEPPASATGHRHRAHSSPAGGRRQAGGQGPGARGRPGARAQARPETTPLHADPRFARQLRWSESPRQLARVSGVRPVKEWPETDR